MGKSTEFPQYEFRSPKSFTRGRVSSSYPDVIVIHVTDGSEGRTSAEDGAAYDARRTDGTSTHFFVDQDSTIQCVLTTDEAHAARTHGNDRGIQIEVCGRASQTAAQWADAASAGAVEQAARLGVAIRKKYGKSRFPLINLTPSQLRAGQNGFCEHKDFTLAYPEDHGTHTDPGPNFPWAKLFLRITELEAIPGVKRMVTVQEFSSHLPVLVKGDQDPVIAGDDTAYVKRAQRELRVKDDGDYGKATAAAVKALGIAGHDGNTIDLAVWARLHALWGATVTGTRTVNHR